MSRFGVEPKFSIPESAGRSERPNGGQCPTDQRCGHTNKDLDGHGFVQKPFPGQSQSQSSHDVLPRNQNAIIRRVATAGGVAALDVGVVAARASPRFDSGNKPVTPLVMIHPLPWRRCEPAHLISSQQRATLAPVLVTACDFALRAMSRAQPALRAATLQTPSQRSPPGSSPVAKSTCRDRKSTRLNSSHQCLSRMPSSA